MNNRLKFTAVFVLLGISVTSYACGNSQDIATVPPIPTRANFDAFQKFIDQSETFSVRYPDTWALRISAMKSVSEFFNQSPLDEEFSVLATVFSAGDEGDGGFEPFSSIIVQTVPTDFDTDEFSASEIRKIRLSVTSFFINTQQSLFVGDIRARITEWTWDAAEITPKKRCG